MVKKKGKSKRETLGHKYKVKRKIKEHNRKLRRAVRKNPEMARKKLKRDPGIPNLFPLKEAMLGRMLKESAKMEAIEERQRNDRKNMLERRRNHNRDKAEQESTQSKVWQASASKEKKRQSWFVKDLKKVLEVSDVVLQVLDARDPMGCRCRRIEKLILGKLSENSPKPKRIILVLNKIDLAPPEVVEQWVRYLKRELPVVAFKSSTQKQGSNLGNSGNFDMHFSKGKAANSAALLQSSKCVGSSALMQLLKNYCRNLDLKTAITVGVIGYPNVGKSSVINSLKRQRVAGVGAQPGFTKQCQMVKLDKLISLVDSPGVLFEADSSDPGVMLRNCLKVEEIEDPLIAVEAIVARASKTKLLEIYQIGDFGGYEEFLLLVARKRGKLQEGRGRPAGRRALRATRLERGQDPVLLQAARRR